MPAAFDGFAVSEFEWLRRFMASPFEGLNAFGVSEFECLRRLSGFAVSEYEWSAKKITEK